MKYLELFDEFIVTLESKIEPTTRSKYIKVMNILNVDECVDYVIDNCTEFINKPIYITRYINKIMGDETLPFYSDPIERVSRDNSNHYTLILDNTEKWKDYPKRGKSFISTLQYEKFSKDNYPEMGNSYLVIPKDNSKWGVCPTDDIYTSFKTLIKYGEFAFKIFDDLNDLTKYLGLDVIRDSNIDDMKSDILKLQKYIRNNKNDLVNYAKTSANNISLLLFENWDNEIWEKIIELFDPETNNFSLEKYTSLNYDGKCHEIWTDSTCLFIPIKDLLDFLTKLREKTNKDIEL